MSLFIIGALTIFGLILGSFINALVWRLGQLLDSEGEPKKLTKKQTKQLSIATGRSICPNCRHQLAKKDLVPLFSWMTLKGRCRYCQKPISKQYPIVEASTALLFVVSYLLWPYSLIGSEWLVFMGFLFALVCLIAVFVYDLLHKIIPTNLVYIGLGVYLVLLYAQSLLSGDFMRLYLAISAAAFFFAIFFAIFFASYVFNKKGWSSKSWLGYGDVRLALLLGLIVGEPILVLVAIFLSSVIGIIITLPSLLTKSINLTSQIPFGPFLIMGSLITFWLGNIMVDWYLNTILFY